MMKPERMFKFLVIFTLLAPFGVLPGIWSPYLGTKFVLFSVLVEVTLPLYLYLIIKEEKNRPNPKNLVFIFLSLYLGLFFISSAFGIDFWNSFFGNNMRMGGLFLHVHVWLYTLYIALMLKRGGPKIKTHLTSLIAALGALAGMYGFLEYLDCVPHLSETYAPRYSVVFGNPALFAAFLVIPFFFALLGITQSKTRKAKSAHALFSLVIFLGILASGTRGAFVGLVCGLFISAVIYLLFEKTKEQKIKILLSAMLASIICIGIFGHLYHNSNEGTLAYRFTHFANQTASQRLHYWSMSLEGWKENPILGVGYENYYQIANTYYHTDLYELENSWPDKPHNLPIEILVTGGLLTAMAYLGLLFVIMRSFYLAYKRDELTKTEFALLTGSLIGYLGQASFLFETVGDLVYIAALYGIATHLEASTIKPTRKHIALPKQTKTIATYTATVGAIALIIFLFKPFLLDLRLAHNANKLAESNDWDTAIETIKQIGTNDFVFDAYTQATNAKTLYLKAIKSTETNEEQQSQLFQIANTAFNEKKDQSPKNARFLFEQLSLEATHANLLQTYDKERVEADITTLAELTPNRTEIYRLKAQFQEAEGDLEKAIVFLDEGLAYSPNEPSLLWFKGGYLLLLNQEEEAADLLFAAIENGQPASNEQVIVWLSQKLIERGDLEKTAVLYEKMILTKPNAYEYYSRLAAVYVALGDNNKAREIAKKLIDRNPEYQEEVNTFLDTLK